MNWRDELPADPKFAISAETAESEASKAIKHLGAATACVAWLLHLENFRLCGCADGEEFVSRRIDPTLRLLLRMVETLRLKGPASPPEPSFPSARQEAAPAAPLAPEPPPSHFAIPAAFATGPLDFTEERPAQPGPQRSLEF